MARLKKTQLKTDTYTFTSESVCSGHPDKICDQISDAIVDAVLAQDPKGRVAVETLVTKDKVVLAGEITANANIDLVNIARQQIKRLGYTNGKFHFSYKSPIDVFVHEQSPEIAVGVDDLGAGDQGMMFGYACNENDSFMPTPILLSHLLAKKIDEAREQKILPYLRPDGKTQVTLKYENNIPISAKKIVIAVPHDEDVAREKVEEDLYKKILTPLLKKYHLSFDKGQLFVNGTGIWHIGGPASDTGVTGRKIVVDTYGGYARVGGGAFSGKDPTKVDRSGAYAARFLAKNIVAHSLADKAEIRLAYVIGKKYPLMQEVETFGTAKVSAKIMQDFCSKILDTTVQGILDGLNLRRPIYLPTAAYGHFGRNEFPWEKVSS